MKQFEFDITITAPNKEDAMSKMTAMKALGKYLSLSELQALASTVSNPMALAVAKAKLGL